MCKIRKLVMALTLLGAATAAFAVTTQAGPGLSRTLPYRAYAEVLSPSQGSGDMIGVNTANPQDILSSGGGLLTPSFRQSQSIAVSKDGSVVCVISGTSVYVYDSNLRLQKQFDLSMYSSQLTALALTPDGSNLFVAGLYPDSISDINLSNSNINPVTDSLIHGPESMMVSQNGQALYVAGRAPYLLAIPMSNPGVGDVELGLNDGALDHEGMALGANSLELSGSQGVTDITLSAAGVPSSPRQIGSISSPPLYKNGGIALSPDGATIYVADTYGHPSGIYAYNRQDGSQQQFIPLTGALGVSVTPDGKQLYVTTVNSTDLIIMNTDGSDQQNIPGQGGTVGFALDNFIG